MSCQSASSQQPSITINGKPRNAAQGQRIPKLDRLSISISEENALEKSNETALTSQLQPFPARLKLRDYLFMAETSARQNATQKRKKLHSHPAQPAPAQQQPTAIRRNKYGVQSSEMFAILKKEVGEQLRDSIESLGRLKDELHEALGERVVPSSQEMMLMYELRTLLKDSMKNSVEAIKQAVKSRSQRAEEVDIQIVLDARSLCADLASTQAIFSRKYEEVASLKQPI